MTWCSLQLCCWCCWSWQREDLK